MAVWARGVLQHLTLYPLNFEEHSWCDLLLCKVTEKCLQLVCAQHAPSLRAKPRNHAPHAPMRDRQLSQANTQICMRQASPSNPPYRDCPPDIVHAKPGAST